MSLQDLKRNWDEFGLQDPLWAILSEPKMKGNLWDLADFFQTGIKEADALFAYLKALRLTLSTGKSLEFGCGVGRVTQAFCRNFDECHGVDISSSMVQQAKEYNRFGSKCHYHMNPDDDLKLFENDSFDLVYTRMVLQHMHPQYSKKYLQEFMRVLSPGGFLVFQVPSEPIEGSNLGSLGNLAYRAQITSNIGPSELSLEAGTSSTLSFKVKNVSQELWPANSADEHSINLSIGNHWLSPSKEVLVMDDGRAWINQPVAPQEEIKVSLSIQPPSPGNYLLEIDMVHEGISWFKDKGGQTLQIPVVVSAPVSEPVRETFVPHFEMHCIPQTEVLDLLKSAGGKILDIQSDPVAGPNWLSYRYLVSK